MFTAFVKAKTGVSHQRHIVQIEAFFKSYSYIKITDIYGLNAILKRLFRTQKMNLTLKTYLDIVPYGTKIQLELI